MTDLFVPDLLPEKILYDPKLTGEEKFTLTLVYNSNGVSNEQLEIILHKRKEQVRKILSKLTSLKLATSKISEDGTWICSRPNKIIKRTQRERGSCSELRSNSLLTSNNNTLSSKTNNVSYIQESKALSMEEVRKFVPDKVFPFLDYWFAKELTLYGEHTKSFAEDVESLKKLTIGKYFVDKNVVFKYMGASFTLEQWKLAVDRFKLACTDANCFPKRKENIRKFTISKFLYNPFSARNNGPDSTSFFLNMLEGPPRRIRHVVEDGCPEITQRFVHLFKEYRKEVFNDYGYRPSEEDKDRFVQATQKTILFFEELKPKLHNFHIQFSRENSFPDFVWAAVLHDVGGADFDVTPGFLCSNRTYEKRLPDYLTYKRIL